MGPSRTATPATHKHTGIIKSWQLTNERSARTGSKKTTRLGEERELFVCVCNHIKGVRRAELAACWHLHMQGVSLPEHLWGQMWFNPHLSSQHTFLKRVKHQHSMPYQMLALSQHSAQWVGRLQTRQHKSSPSCWSALEHDTEQLTALLLFWPLVSLCLERKGQFDQKIKKEIEYDC